MGNGPHPTAPRPLRRWWLGVLAYVVAALTWILVTDLLLFGASEEPRWWSIAKGGAFVLVTAAVLAVVLAVSSRRLQGAVRSLSARQRELAVLGAHVNDLVYIYELVPEPRFAFVSDSAERLIGFGPEAHYADPTLGRRLVHPDDRHRLDDIEGLAGTVRLRWRHGDGHTVWVEQHNHLQRQDGRPTALVGVARDITAEVLHEGTAAVLERLSTGVLVEAQAIDTVLHRTIGSLAELLEADEVAVGVDARSGSCRGHRLVVGGAPAAAPREELVVGETTLSAVLSPDAPDRELVQSALTAAVEAIDRVHAAERRDLEHRQVLQALEATASAVLLTDPEGRIRYVNQAFTAMTGYPPGEVIGDTPSVLSSGVHDDGFYRRLWDTITEGRSFADQVVNRRRDGSHFTAAVTIDPVFERDGRLAGFVGVQKDITAEQAVRDRLHRRELEALGSQRDIEQDRSLLVQTISHELRTPLTVIVGAAETLQRPGLSPEVNRSVLTALDRASGQLLGRMDVLLAATDGLVGIPERNSLRSLVHAALSGVARTRDTERVSVEGDADWFGHAVLAKALLAPLLDNALKYAPVQTPVVVSISRAGDGALMLIADRGTGIDPGFLPVLGEPFRQQDPGRTRQHGGLGLGLYAVLRAARRLGADLRFGRGHDGVGTVVTVTLPDEIDDATSMPTPGGLPVADPGR